MTRLMEGVVVVAVAAALALAACSGDDADVDASVDTPPSTTTTSTTSAPLGPVGDAPAPPDCPPPFPPVASVDQYSGSTDQLPPVGGEDTFVGLRAPQSLDTDADGQSDEIVPKDVISDPAILDRGDGRIRFERPGLVASILPVGNVDGDDRDDLGVSLSELADQGSPVRVGFYVVPGSVAPGTYDPADVGIRFDGAVITIGDRDGDGIDELLHDAQDGTTQIIAGEAIADVEAPADVSSIPPMLVVPGDALGLADLGGEVPAVVTGELIEAPEAAGVLHLADEEGDRRFTTAPEPWVVNYTSAFAAPSVFVADDGVHLVLSQAERSAARSYLWRVDDPCRDPAG